MTALTRIGAAGASALLALGLFAAAPAGASDDHEPSSEDKARAAKVTCLSSDGKTQGRSTSDPDGMSNGGPDKPGCTSAIDADSDGNNGCGNDADREDDNNGHCGLKAQSSPSGDDETDEQDEPSSTTTTADDDSEPVTEPSEVEKDADADDADDADKDDEAGEDDADNDDAVTGDDGTADSSTESPDEPKSLPLDEAGAGFGALALLGGIVRLFLRIG